METNDTLRALIVDFSSNFGGANARVLALMKKLPVHSIGLATLEGSVIADELEALGYAVHRLAVNKFDPRIPFRLATVIRTHGYRVVDTQNPQSKLWGSMAALLTRTALISTLNSWYMNEHPRFSPRWFIYTVLELVTNINLSRYIVVSREIQNAMLDMGIDSGKIDLIYNAVELDESRIAGNKQRLLTQYDLPDNSIICLAAGRLAWAKAHDILIDALSKARLQNLAIVCLIAGEGELYDRLSEQIRRLQLEKSVLLVGHLTHDVLLDCLKACDIYVMPSRTEGTPVALLEAAVLGKPIIASNVGGIPELITNEQHGLLVDSEDVDALSVALLRVSSDVGLASLLGGQAKTWVRMNFSLDMQAKLTLEAYAKAMMS